MPRPCPAVTVPRRLVELAREPLGSVLGRLGVRDGWDYVLFGDASGSPDESCFGWACVAVAAGAPAGKDRFVFSGAGNASSLAQAEAMAFFLPLHWASARERALKREGPRLVHLVTDNAACCRAGRKTKTSGPAGSVLWKQFEAFGEDGLSLTWHHVGAETVGLHAYADRLSRSVRLLHDEGAPRDQVFTTHNGEKAGAVRDINPRGSA